MEKITINNEDEIVKKYMESKNDLNESKENIKKAKKEKKENKATYNKIIDFILSDTFADSNNEEIQKIRKLNKERKEKIVAEVFNGITHGIGTFLGILGFVLLLIKANTSIEYISYIIYGISLIGLFLASTLYHSLIFTKARPIFQVIDHSSIFLLIAGSYAPYCLLAMPRKVGVPLLITIWIIGILGVLGKIFFFEKIKKINNILYIIMGWLIIFTIKDIIKVMPISGIILMILSGLSYTGGVLFYRKKDKAYNHVIWHLFVLLGAILMYLSIYLYL